jgi:Terminase large subunit, T4likevirus-type, N-terminal
MKQNSYKVIEGSHADKFHSSRAKVRLFGGGFANGKTTGLVAETLKVAVDYPGCAILMARATYPKLNSTLRREFVKWCPVDWIKSFDKSKENSATLKNSTIIDFRYIDQSKGADGEGTSNLLSANYDLIVVDQVDDVEITHEDFLNLLGRLRGSTPYAGDDITMPRTGPRMIIMSCNPTLGWPYKRIVKPVHDLRSGRHNPDLICEVDSDGKPVLVNGNPIPLVDVFEASTYENQQNLEGDYIKLLEATYRGKMRDRYLLGKWVAFDGVVYEEFDENLHIIPDNYLRKHLSELRMAGERQGIAEGYDFGLTAPSCYLMSLTDASGNTYIVDGFYEPNAGIDWQAEQIKSIRAEHHPQEVWMQTQEEISADPQIFKRTNAGMRTVGDSVAEMFRQHGIIMVRGNNNILNGIVKVKQYLIPQMTVLNPFTHTWGCPKLFISDKLTWLRDEFNSYRWKKNRGDETVDKPVDGRDHAMDTLKYLLSKRPAVGRLYVNRGMAPPSAVMKWHETDADIGNKRGHRYR